MIWSGNLKQWRTLYRAALTAGVDARTVTAKEVVS